MAAKERKPGVKRSPEIEVEILERMSRGEPLAVICRSNEERFPAPGTWNQWCQDDSKLSIAHARARDAGYDHIAMDCLNIADANGLDVRYSETGEEIVNTDVIQRAKLRVETRLKLLAKWDPKRYGERLDQFIEIEAGPKLLESTRERALAIVSALDRNRRSADHLIELNPADS